MALGREGEGQAQDAAPTADSFDIVYEAHHTYVHGLVYALLGDAQDAEDVTQEVFLSVYRALPTYKAERAGLRTWVTKLAVNACRMHRRRNFLRNLLQRRGPSMMGAHGSDEDGVAEAVDLSLLGAPEAFALQSEARRVLMGALASLRHEHRAALVLRYYLDLPCQEIARILDCPEGTVYSRLYYARRMVQAHLERHALKEAQP
jgi:RNA polymerase sigma-70 factor (ECF subfamily)